MPLIRAAIYARQSVLEDQGIRQQVADCRDKIARLGWQEALVYDKDNDVSGSSNRGEKTDWSKMLRAYDRGEFDALVVTETSRLTRRLTDVLEITAPRRDMRVIVIRENIDTAGDDYLLKQLVLLAEREVKLKVQRDQRYAVERRKAGHPTAGRTPYGYDWVVKADRDPQTQSRYKIIEHEAKIVKDIFERFLNGVSMGQIARDLTSAGQLTRKNTKWHASTIRRVLMNPQYAALLAPSQETGKFDIASIKLEECTPGAWDPIVDMKMIAATRGKLVGVKPNHQGTARKWLLPGIAVCDTCGGPVTSARGETHPTSRVDGSGKAEQKRYHAYRCKDGGHFMRGGDIVDEFIEELCIGRLSAPDVAKLLTVPDDGIDVVALHTQRVELQGREVSIAMMVAKGQFTPQAAEPALEELKRELRSIDALIARTVRRNPLAELAGVDDVRGWWEGLTLGMKRTIVTALMEVRIKPVGYGNRVTTLEGCAESVAIAWRS